MESKATHINDSHPASQELAIDHIKTFGEKERTAYLIAKSTLGSSFDLKKLTGYLTYCKTQTIKK